MALKTPLLEGESVLADKLSNARIDAARPSALFDLIASAFGSPNDARAGVDIAKSLVGGIWVGGRATVTTHRVIFEPNAVNRALHANVGGVAVLLSSLTDVRVRWGFITSIVDFGTSEGVLSIRCFGAKAFAAQVRVAAGLD